jgi:hypothetical protein
MEKTVRLFTIYHLPFMKSWQREIRLGRSAAEIEPALDRWVTF